MPVHGVTSRAVRPASPTVVRAGLAGFRVRVRRTVRLSTQSRYSPPDRGSGPRYPSYDSSESESESWGCGGTRAGAAATAFKFPSLRLPDLAGSGLASLTGRHGRRSCTVKVTVLTMTLGIRVTPHRDLGRLSGAGRGRVAATYVTARAAARPLDSGPERKPAPNLE